MKIHWWKPKRRKFPQSSQKHNVFTYGKGKSEIFRDEVSITKHGIVFITVELHSERLLKDKRRTELNYFTHYALVHNGWLWVGKSWGGGFEPMALRKRANKFARDVMRLTQDEANAQPVSPSKEAELEIERLKDGLQRLVDLVLSLMTTLERYGIVWSSREDYPLALRNALRLLSKGGTPGE